MKNGIRHIKGGMLCWYVTAICVSGHTLQERMKVHGLMCGKGCMNIQLGVMHLTPQLETIEYCLIREVPERVFAAV